MQLYPIEVRDFFQQRSACERSAKKGHRLAESHSVIEFDKANHIAAAATAIAIEQILGGIDQETRLAIVVQRAESQKSSAGHPADRLPML